MSLTRISKALSCVLRHDPELIGVELDSKGWGNIKEVCSGLSTQKKLKGHIINKQLIEKIVADCDKQRYSISSCGKYIRANQGHSIKVDVELKEKIPPGILYHGTVSRYLIGIKHEGINKGSRNYVHLSDDKNTAMNVGSRRGKPVILRVDSHNMHRHGYKFYISVNCVWLTEHVPEKYIYFPQE